MKMLRVPPIVMLAACSGSPESRNDPLAGTIHGTSFEVLGSYAESRGGVLYVTLVNTPSSCGAFPAPAASLLRLDLTVPPQSQRVGAFPFGPDDAAPRASITWFTDAGGTLHQNSSIVESGTLEVRDAGAAIIGALAISGPEAALSGVFGAALCP